MHEIRLGWGLRNLPVKDWRCEVGEGFREQAISTSLELQRKHWTHVCLEGRGWDENHKAFTGCPRACEQGGI